MSEQDNRWPHVGSAVIVLDGQGRVLLGRRTKPGCPADGKWVLPGGRIEPFELITQAGHREVAEETGLQVSVMCPRGYYELVGEHEHRIVFLSRSVTILGGDLRAGGDMAEVRFVALADVSRYDLAPLTRRMLTEENCL